MYAVAPSLPEDVQRQSSCTNCGSALAGPYCHACGQQVRHERLTLRAVGRHAVATIFNLDRGLLHTAWSLLLRPARVVHDVIAGRTAAYTSPVRYFVICVTATQLLLLWTGALEAASEGFTDGWNESRTPEDGEVSPRNVFAFFNDYFFVLAITLVPLMAVLACGLFRRAGFNVAEYLVAQLYIGAQMALFMGVWLGLSQVPIPEPWGSMLTAVMLAGMYGYYVWSMASFSRLSRWSVLARAVALTVVGGILYMMLTAIVLAMYESTF